MKELIKIQSELKAPKSQENKFGNYNYRSLEDIMEALKPLLLANNCFVTLSDQIEMVTEDRIYVKATATITNSEGATVSTTAFAREPFDKKGSDASQITGAASSYARKYAMNGLFAIDDTKDADATNDHGKGKQQAQPVSKQLPPPTMTIEQAKGILEMASTLQELAQGFTSLPRKYKKQLEQYKDQRKAELVVNNGN